MDNENKDTNPPKETTTQAPLTDDEVSKMISEIEQDLNKQKESWKAELETKIKSQLSGNDAKKDEDILKMSKEMKEMQDKYAKLEETYKKSTEEVITKYTNQMKEQFDKINAELVKRQTAVADSKNPFRKVVDEKTNKVNPQWYMNPDMTEAEKVAFFEAYCLK